MDPDAGDYVHFHCDGHGIDADAFRAYDIDKHSEKGFPLRWRKKRCFSFRKMFLSTKDIYFKMRDRKGRNRLRRIRGPEP